MARALRYRAIAVVTVVFFVVMQIPCLLRIAQKHQSEPHEGSAQAAVDATPCPPAAATSVACPACPTLQPPSFSHRELKMTEVATPARLPPVAPLYRMKIIVFTYNRLPGLRRLISSLVSASYDPAIPVSLHVFCDFPKKAEGVGRGGAPPPPPPPGMPKATHEFLDELQWPHGEYHLHRRQVNVGLKRSILEAWYPTSDKEVAAFFEDDIEVSQHWFTWADAALRRYAFPGVGAAGEEAKGEDAARATSVDPKLLGISLFRPIHDELSGRGCVVKNNFKPFLLQQPCSWGAVYLPRPWRSFRNWYDEVSPKGDPKLRDAADPAVRPSSNSWDHGSSWKKYLIKLMYQRGWFMVYPNLPDRMVFSTNHLMEGEHPTPPKALFELPLLPRDMKGLREDEVFATPPLSALRAFDVMFRPAPSGMLETLPNYRP